MTEIYEDIFETYELQMELRFIDFEYAMKEIDDKAEWLHQKFKNENTI